MQLTLVNFGGFKGSHLHTFESRTVPNGQGKTTMVNAYIFALSGRTLTGFEPEYKYKNEGEPTSVTLHHFLGLPPIRRTLGKNGTTLYVGDDVATQADFVSVLESRGYSLDFILACANANALVSDSLNTEALRKLLAATDLVDGDDYKKIKKELTDTRKQLKAAEVAAQSNVVIPVETIQPLTKSEVEFNERFIKNKRIFDEGVQACCPACKRDFDQQTLDQLTRKFEVAESMIKGDREEFMRIVEKRALFEGEQQEIDLAKLAVKNAEKARKDVDRLKGCIEALERDIQTLDAEAIDVELPEGVTLITERVAKNGNVKAVCELEFAGIPIKTVNRAARMMILVDLLNIVRKNKGVVDVPIIVDNAEAVEHDFNDIDNIVCLYVPK